MALVLAPSAHGQSYPNKPVRIIVPFGSGSGADTNTRFFGNMVSKALGQPLVVENRPGASGILAVMAVKGSPADGYTLLTGTNSPMTVNPVVMKDLPYDPIKEFRPVILFGLIPAAFIVHGSSPHRTVADLVAATKASKSALQIGTYSAGYELASAWFGMVTGVPITTVPYKGAAAVMTDVLGNQLPAGAIAADGVVTYAKDGRLRVLATTADVRQSALPNVPTMKESGFPDLVMYTWSGIFVRAETPDPIVTKLYESFGNAMASPEGRAFLASAPIVEVNNTPKELQAFVVAEHERFRQIARAAGIKPQ
ncbi:MAG TPA: tripartite tricarboxylate transporter substrate binding protein [Burkholderiales bacterium]|nr:tripartite tricarboxylate transporter substrate binding protein [Burkholderiales bacterium]